MPKLYFYDTGLACSLLGIENKNQVSSYHLKGNLFESFIISELFKARYNKGLEPNCYFWRDKLGREIDCIVEKTGKLTPVEIKAGKTASIEYFKDISYWNKLSKNKALNSYVVFGGNTIQRRSQGNLIPWSQLNSIPV